MYLIYRLQNAAARSVRGALKRIKKMPSAIGAVALALASFLAWAPPAAAIDTTNYVPFAAKAICTNATLRSRLNLRLNSALTSRSYHTGRWSTSVLVARRLRETDATDQVAETR